MCDVLPRDADICQLTSPLLGVDSDEREVVPDFAEQIVQVELHLTADDHAVRSPCQPIHLFEADLVYLVVALWRKREGEREGGRERGK